MARHSDQIYDELLVLRCQDGESAALEELVERWHERFRRHALRLSASPEAAGDAVQEAWIAIVRGLGKLHDPAFFRPWAYRIVTHKCADQARRVSRRREVTEEIGRSMDLEAAVDPGDSDEPSEITALRSAMASLPADRRALLALHYLEELGVREIATVLDIPEGTVKSRLFNARRALKKVLEQKTQKKVGSKEIGRKENR